MTARREKVLGLALAVAVAAMTAAACDEGSAVKEKAAGPAATPAPLDGGPSGNQDGGPLPDGAPRDCVLNPTTHEEIINGCTDAVKITKVPDLPLLAADGGLPPLP